MKEYQEKFPQFSKEADVLRHTIVLLEKDMKKQDGKDELSILVKKASMLEKTENKMNVEMDILNDLFYKLFPHFGVDRN